MSSGRTLNLIDNNIIMKRITYSMQHWSGTFIRSLPLFLSVCDIAQQIAVNLALWVYINISLSELFFSLSYLLWRSFWCKISLVVVNYRAVFWHCWLDDRDVIQPAESHAASIQRFCFRRSKWHRKRKLVKQKLKVLVVVVYIYWLSISHWDDK